MVDFESWRSCLKSGVCRICIFSDVGYYPQSKVERSRHRNFFTPYDFCSSMKRRFHSLFYESRFEIMIITHVRIYNQIKVLHSKTRIRIILKRIWRSPLYGFMPCSTDGGAILAAAAALFCLSKFPCHPVKYRYIHIWSKFNHST